MTQRLDYRKSTPQGLSTLRQLQDYVEDCGLEHSLLELVKTRASQINGCAYCLDMHTKDARAAGETEQRLYTLSAWRETPFFSDRERAALAWTEVLTRISEYDVDDSVYEEARKYFSEKEIVDLSLAIVAINGWNRLAIPFKSPPGSYQPRKKKSSTPERYHHQWRTETPIGCKLKGHLPKVATAPATSQRSACSCKSFLSE